MKIKYTAEELGSTFSEIFEHGCFGDSIIVPTFEVTKDGWVTDANGNHTRIIKEAKLLSVELHTLTEAEKKEIAKKPEWKTIAKPANNPINK